MQSADGRIGSCPSCSGMNDVVHVSYFLRATHPTYPYHLVFFFQDIEAIHPLLQYLAKPTPGPYSHSQVASACCPRNVRDRTRPVWLWHSLCSQDRHRDGKQYVLSHVQAQRRNYLTMEAQLNSQGSRWPRSVPFIFIASRCDTASTSMLIETDTFYRLKLIVPF